MSMKKPKLHSLLSVALLCAVTAPAVTAATVENYLEKFDNVLVTPEKSFGLKYWTRYVRYDYERHKFTNPAEGGQDGAYLRDESSLYSDYIITPEVEGEVSFYGKLNVASGAIDVFEAVSDGTNWTFTPVTVDGRNALNTDSWAKLTLTVPDGGMRHLAFKMASAGIDEFAAAKANLEDVRALKIDGALTEKDAINVNLDAQGTTTFDLAITVSNSGTVDLAQSDWGVDFYLGTYSEPLKTKAGEVHPGAIAATSSQTFNATVTLTVPESEWNQTRYITAVETVSNTNVKVNEKSMWGSSQFNKAFVPYLPVIGITGGGDKPLANAFGMGRAESGAAVTRTLYIINTAGAAPLTVTDIKTEGGFTLQGEKAFTVEAGQMKGVEIGYTSENLGRHEGKVTVSSAELADFEWPLEVLVTPAGLRSYNFDDAMPAGFIVDKAWAQEELPEILAVHDGDKAMGIVEFTQKPLVTPRLKFAEGEKLYFDLAARKTAGKVEVQVSTDRINWQPALVTISSNQSEAANKLNTDATGQKAGAPCYFKPYEVTMPAGNWFVRFNGFGVYLDNVAGGAVADLPVDVYMTSWDIPEETFVNNSMLATLSLRNMGGDIDKDAYSVSLVIGGEVVASATAPALEKNEATTYEIDYTPHKAVESAEALIRFTMGEYVVETPVSDLTVKPESPLKDCTIGLVNPNNYSEDQPIRALKRDYCSESVYPAELLGAIASGESISKITWLGCGYYGSFPTVKAKVYMANTTDTKAGDAFTSTDGMELVFDGELTLDRNVISGMEPFTVAQLDKEFVYTGGGLRILVEIAADPDISSDYYNYDRYATDSRYTSGCRYVTRSGDESLGQLPVIVLTKRVPVPAFSGKVSDAATEAPVAGALVTLKSGEVLYEAHTADDGSYSMDIYQAGLDYELTATAEGYFDWTGENVSFAEGNKTQDIAMREAKVAVGGRLVCGGDAVAGVSVTLAAEGGEPMQCDTDASGRFEFETRALNTTHTLTVESPMFTTLSREVPVAEDDIDLGDIELTSGVAEITSDGLSARGGNGCIFLSGNGCRATVTDLAGRIIAVHDSIGGHLTIGPLPAGVYLANGIKVIVK